MGRVTSRALRAFALAFVLGCIPAGPEAIAFGSDLCAFCRMLISDPRFAAELVTDRGRSMKFDSVDCLLSYVKKTGAGRSAWVSDYRHPGTMLDVDSARFVNLGPGRTPMGRGWAAVASAGDAAALGITSPDSVKRWREVQ